MIFGVLYIRLYTFGFIEKQKANQTEKETNWVAAGGSLACSSEIPGKGPPRSLADSQLKSPG